MKVLILERDQETGFNVKLNQKRHLTLTLAKTETGKSMRQLFYEWIDSLPQNERAERMIEEALKTNKETECEMV